MAGLADIGQMTERLTVQSKTATSDTQGGRAEVWGTFATIWGWCQPMGGRELKQAQAVGSDVKWRVTVRYRADITPKMRLLWDAYQATVIKTLEIHTVTMRDGTPDYLDLECGEVI